MRIFDQMNDIYNETSRPRAAWPGAALVVFGGLFFRSEGMSMKCLHKPEIFTKIVVSSFEEEISNLFQNTAFKFFIYIE